MQEIVPVGELKVGMHVTIPGSWFKHPFIRSRFVVSSQRDIKWLTATGISQIPVDLAKSTIAAPELTENILPENPDESEYREMVPPGLMEALTDRAAAREFKAYAVKSSSKIIMKRLMEKTPDAGMLCEARESLYEVIDCILDGDQLNQFLLTISDHDMYTYTHSVNVGVLSLLLAKKYFGSSDRHNLRELGVGFFLHDLGKTQVDPAIINKKGKLTFDEMQAMRRHPLYGFNILNDANQLTTECKLIILEHHEREDGSGYPYGLYGEEIHVYARICSLVDMYDALTTDRPYRSKISPFEALNIVKSEINDSVQKCLFENLVLILGDN
jgi:HD-GYP domain-containing protein (c-di-GMP phosphodiesterase class II)